MHMSNKDSDLDVFDVLTIIFITLKMIGVQPVANWSWWVVLTPVWVNFAIMMLACIIMWFVSKKGSEK